jgi:RNA polymerase sigma-70 factor (ECF subfamily)
MPPIQFDHLTRMILASPPSFTSTKLTRPIDKPLPRTATLETSIDDALVQRFTAGDEAAFVEIMERYRGKIFAATLRLLRNHADAEEVTQDTFIRAHRALANFRGDSSLATWLYRIGLNLARNRYWYFFRRRRQDSFSLDAALGTDNPATFCDLVADAGQDPAQQTVAREFTSVVDHCMQGLDAHQREILTLRNVLHRSYEEIAATLGINVGTVKSRIARARESLRMRLAETFPEFAPETAPSQWFLPSQPTYGSPVVICA